MRQVAIPQAFDPVARTVDVSNVVGLDPRLIVAILDTSAPGRPTLYDMVTPGLRFVATAGAVMTLEYDTSGLTAQDWLVVFYDDGQSVGDAVVEIADMLAPAAIAANLAALPDAQLETLLGALLAALPDEKTAAIPAAGKAYVNADGYVVISQ